jgi:hypothetical protein
MAAVEKEPLAPIVIRTTARHDSEKPAGASLLGSIPNMVASAENES